MNQQKPSNKHNESFLRRAILGNGIFTILSGLSLLALSNLIAPLLGVNQPIALSIIGLGLGMYAIFLFGVARQVPINKQFAVTIIVLDLVWVVGSIFLILTQIIPFSRSGNWIVAIAADIVSIFAILQFVGLRRTIKITNYKVVLPSVK
jgi:hypothetical protein